MNLNVNRVLAAVGTSLMWGGVFFLLLLFLLNVDFMTILSCIPVLLGVELLGSIVLLVAAYRYRIHFTLLLLDVFLTCILTPVLPFVGLLLMVAVTDAAINPLWSIVLLLAIVWVVGVVGLAVNGPLLMIRLCLLEK